MVLRGPEKPGILAADGTIRDLSGLVPDTGRAVVSDAGRSLLRTLDTSTRPVVDPAIRKGIRVAGTGKIVCIGLDQADHAAESGLARPIGPVILMKATSAICGPDDPIIISRTSVKTDREVGLARITGTTAWPPSSRSSRSSRKPTDFLSVIASNHLPGNGPNASTAGSKWR